MLVLGLMGSPRRGGNTDILVSTFIKEVEAQGATALSVEISQKEISPCTECGTCEREGFCPINDDMQGIYELLRLADLVVLGTPIFFYGPTAQIKALIDRSQALWVRRYIHSLTDPGGSWRKGFMIAVGATKGKNLFDGTSLTAKYFFDAIGAEYVGYLGFRRIEAKGAIKDHPTALGDIRKKAREILQPFLGRKKILFLCSENACRSQMAAAFARFYAGDRFEVKGAGIKPSKDVNPLMVQVMAEKGIDMAYLKPQTVDNAMRNWTPEIVISMGCKDDCPYLPGAFREEWDLPDPSGNSIEFVREIRDKIEEHVRNLVA